MFNKKSLAILFFVFSFHFYVHSMFDSGSRFKEFTRDLSQRVDYETKNALNVFRPYYSKLNLAIKKKMKFIKSKVYLPQKTRDNEISYLDFLCRCGDVKKAKEMLKDRKDINALLVSPVHDEQLQPLSIACWAGNIDIVKWLVDQRDADVNVKNKNGRTPLHFACHASGCSESDRLKIVTLFVEKGADINATYKDHLNNEDIKPVDVSFWKNQSEVIEYLIRADDNFDLMKEGLNLFHWASAYGKEGLMYVLLKLCKERGIDIPSYVNTKDEDGNSSLSKVYFGKAGDSHLGMQDRVKFLIARGADVNAALSADVVAYLNYSYQNVPLAKQLLQNGADVGFVCRSRFKDNFKEELEKNTLLNKHVEGLQKELDSEKDHYCLDTIERQLFLIDPLMCDRKTPVYTKQKAISCLLRIHKRLPSKLSKEKMMSYFNQIIFNQRFLTEAELKDAVVFASKNHCKDTFYSSVLVAAVRFCEEEKIGSVLATILAENPLIYENEAMFRKFLKESNASCGKTLFGSFKNSLYREFYSAEYKKSECHTKAANDFINALHLAKSMGRKKVFRMLANRSIMLDELKEILAESLPDEIVAHIASFLRGEKSLYCRK